MSVTQIGFRVSFRLGISKNLSPQANPGKARAGMNGFGKGSIMRQVLALLIVFAATSAAQEFRATISGRVTDTQNAVIDGVKIVATQIGTEAKYETASDASGIYTVPFLPPGSYRLTAESPGFKRYVRDNVAAGANERLGID